MILDSKTQAVHQSLNDVGYAFDPTTITRIIATIMALFKGCGLTPAQAEQRAARPRLLDRLRLRRLVRQHSAGDTEALEAALLDAGQDLTQQDIQELYAEPLVEECKL